MASRVSRPHSTTAKQDKSTEPTARRASDSSTEAQSPERYLQAKIDILKSVLEKQASAAQTEEEATDASAVKEVTVEELPVDDKPFLLAELLEALSQSLQKRYNISGRKYFINGKPLDCDEVFGVQGLLVILLYAMEGRINAGMEGNASSVPQRNFKFKLACKTNKDALAEVVPVLEEGDPFDVDSFELMQDTIVKIVDEIEPVATGDEKQYHLDSLYEAFYEKAQNSQIHFVSRDDLGVPASERIDQLREADRCDDAIPLLCKVLRIRTCVLGSSHPSTQECQKQINIYVEVISKSNDAVGKKKILEWILALHDEGHERTLNAQRELAAEYRKIGEIKPAREILDEALRNASSSLGPEHELTKALKEDRLALTGASAGSGNVDDKTVFVCDGAAFKARQASETEKDNQKKITNLVGLTLPKRLPAIQKTVFAEIERIGAEQPNFAEVTELLLDTLHSQAIAGRPAQLPPMLLSGPPGVGKTRYIKRIANVLGLPFTDIQLAGVPEAFKICGLSRYWGTAGEGTVASVFARQDIANPIFLLDEIDKAKQDEKVDPLAVVLLLLEKESSRTFMDSFVDVPLDVSHASFIATANDISKLSDPLLSRFHVIEIEPLDSAGRRIMVDTTFRELLAEEELTRFLDAAMPEATLEALALCEALNGRELKREILLAMRRACREFSIGQDARPIPLAPQYLKLPESKPSRTMGFIS